MSPGIEQLPDQTLSATGYSVYKRTQPRGHIRQNEKLLIRVTTRTHNLFLYIDVVLFTVGVTLLEPGL